MNNDTICAETIAYEYASKDTSKVIVLACVMGVVVTFVLGMGMCLSMGRWARRRRHDGAGDCFGVLGLVGAGCNYPIYKKLLQVGK